MKYYVVCKGVKLTPVLTEAKAKAEAERLKQTLALPVEVRPDWRDVMACFSR